MSNAKVVIVEDEAVTAMNEEQLLTEMGHEVVGVYARGEDALAEIETLNPDLVIMDIKIKGDMTGLELAKAIEKRIDTVVVYVTAFGDKHLFNPEDEDCTMNRYLVKPFTQEEFEAYVKAALETVQVRA